MKKFTILPMVALLVLILLGLVYGDEVSTRAPADGIIDSDGNLSGLFTAKVQASAGRNLSNVTLWTNATGTWLQNLTANGTFAGAFNGSPQAHDVMFTIDSNHSDGFTYVWAIRLMTNATDNIHNSTFTTNRTVRIELAPTVTSNSVGVANSSLSAVPYNFTVGTQWQDPVTTLTCDVFANDSGSTTMIFKTRLLATNNTHNDLFLSLEEENDINVATQCWETAQDAVFAWSSNITFDVDRTTPVLGVPTINNSANQFSNNGALQVEWPITEANPRECTLFNNGTGVWLQNSSYTAFGSNLVNATHDVTLADGDYVFGGYCWDFAGNNLTITNYTLSVDSVPPLITLHQNLSQKALLTVMINFTTDELTNSTISYGNATGDLAFTDVINSDNVTVHRINISVEEGTTFFYNLTVTDRAGNENISLVEYTIQPQSGVYAGWNSYGIFDSSITLGSIANSSMADFVYFWNNTGQSWIAHSGGTGTNAGFSIKGGDVVWLFDSAGSTWDRNVNTALGPYDVNLSSGGNFVSAQQAYTFSSLTLAFRNASEGSRLQNFSGLGGNASSDASEVEFYSFFNNSDQRYSSHFRNASFNNLSGIAAGAGIYIGTPLNITWNGTHITTNWTVSG